MTSLLLPLLVGLPLLVALLVPLLSPGKNGQALHAVALLSSLVLLVLTGLAWMLPASSLAVELPWLPQFGISFALGADGISLTLATLTAFLSVMATVASFSNITQRFKLYYSMFFLLIASVMGVFLSRDLFLFLLFFELELIPMYLLIAVWGGPRRDYAAMKFVLYTLFGSVFLLASLFGLYFIGRALGADPSSLFMFDTLKAIVSVGGLPITTQILLFLGFFIAFSVKLPVVPLHTWLPDAHVEAPTPISMLLAGILLKMGAYGMLRFGFELLPQAAAVLAPYIGLLALINILYTASIALVQKDMKKLIAYSSVSHMGFVLLGLCALNAIGFSAAVFVMVSHGLVSAALFMAVGTLYLRTHTRDIAQYGGAGQRVPVLFYFFMVMAMASLGLPFLISFAGETLVFYGAFVSNAFTTIPLGALQLPLSVQWVTALSALGVVLGAAYLLWLLKRVFFGELSPACAHLRDATRSEVVVLASLTLLIVGFGVFPQWLNARYQTEVQRIAEPYVALLPVNNTQWPQAIWGQQSKADDGDVALVPQTSSSSMREAHAQ